MDHVIKSMFSLDKEQDEIEEENSQYSEGGSDSEEEDDDYNGLEKKMLARKIVNYINTFAGGSKNRIKNPITSKIKKRKKSKNKNTNKNSRKFTQFSKFSKRNDNLRKSMRDQSSKSNTRTSRINEEDSRFKNDSRKLHKRIDLNYRQSESRGNDSEVSLNQHNTNEYPQIIKRESIRAFGSTIKVPVGRSSEQITKSLLKLVRDERERTDAPRTENKVSRKNCKMFTF